MRAFFHLFFFSFGPPAILSAISVSGSMNCRLTGCTNAFALKLKFTTSTIPDTVKTARLEEFTTWIFNDIITTVCVNNCLHIHWHSPNWNTLGETHCPHIHWHGHNHKSEIHCQPIIRKRCANIKGSTENRIQIIITDCKQSSLNTNIFVNTNLYGAFKHTKKRW